LGKKCYVVVVVVISCSNTWYAGAAAISAIWFGCCLFYYVRFLQQYGVILRQLGIFEEEKENADDDVDVMGSIIFQLIYMYTLL